MLSHLVFGSEHSRDERLEVRLRWDSRCGRLS